MVSIKIKVQNSRQIKSGEESREFSCGTLKLMMVFCLEIMTFVIENTISTFSVIVVATVDACE